MKKNYIKKTYSQELLLANAKKWNAAPIPSTHGLYGATTGGRILNLRNGREVKAFEQNAGYMLLSLGVKGVRYQTTVHRLVMEAYHGKCPEGMEVHHKDSDKKNNAVWNLEYITRKGNMMEAQLSGNMLRKLTLGQRNVIIALLEARVSVAAILRFLPHFKIHVSDSTIRHIAKHFVPHYFNKKRK